MPAYERGRVNAFVAVQELAWPGRVAMAAGFAGFMALMSHLSIPLPWTPVPFSFQVVGVLVTGAYLGRHYALLSVGMYVAAGAIGLPVFADQESTGIEVLTGYTAGYILGFAAAVWLVGWYMARARPLLDRTTGIILVALLGLMGAAALTAFAWIAGTGQQFDAAWSPTRSAIWLVTGATILAAAAAVAITRQAQGRGLEKLNLWLVMVAAIGLIHLCGVPVLKWSLGWSWPQAIALGSVVFLPFDLLKAAIGVAACLPFLPGRNQPDRESPAA